VATLTEAGELALWKRVTTSRVLRWDGLLASRLFGGGLAAGTEA